MCFCRSHFDESARRFENPPCPIGVVTSRFLLNFVVVISVGDCFGFFYQVLPPLFRNNKNKIEKCKSLRTPQFIFFVLAQESRT